MVGDESATSSKFIGRRAFVTSVRKLLPTSYLQLCDKFAIDFTAAYYDNLIRLKQISDPGTQQLLLDVSNLKTLFLKLRSRGT
jgi:hypothetical protein